MKRLTAILILSIFLTQGIGVFIAFRYQQYHIRKEIKQRLKQGVPETELHLFSFTNEELNKLEWKKAHEFRYKGKMYDIVKRSESNGINIFQCIVDDQETVLFAHLDEMVNRETNNNSKNSGKRNTLMKVFSNPFLLTQTIRVFKSEFSTTIDFYYHLEIPKGIHKLPYLPPRLV